LRKGLPYAGNGSAFLAMNKLEKLKSILKKMDSVLIAYSGGVDSSLLLKVARSVIPKRKLLAVTADSLTYPKEELNFSRRIAKSLRVKHAVITSGELKNKNFTSNPSNRCYFCKRGLFSQLKKIAAEKRLKFVLDASNISDKKDFRPGDKAKKELGVRSPLQEAGLTKEDIRRLSKKLRLSTWNKPSMACLASRIPYGKEISRGALLRISLAERHLKGLGFKQVRVRHYDKLCSIEVLKTDINRLVNKREEIVKRFRKIGYNHVAIDLQGYRTGSLNEEIRK